MNQSNTFDRNLFVNNSGLTGAIVDFSENGSSILNSTFYANVGDSGTGALWVNYNSANTYISNSTFVNNVAKNGGYAGAMDGGGKIHLTNSILYNNNGVSGECDQGTISHGGNLSTPSSARCNLNHPTDLIGSPKLGPLQNNGGFAQTLALLPNSPGIDQGLGETCPTIDQRGVSRPSRSICDIGAFEVQ